MSAPAPRRSSSPAAPALVGLGVLGAALAACAPSPHTLAGGGVTPLWTRPVEWNPSHAPIGPVVAVADAGSHVVVFQEGAATVFQAGALVATDRTVARWTGAGTLPAADGGGTWLVGLDGDGHLRRLRDGSSFEPVSDRYGLASERVLSFGALAFGALASRGAGFALEGSLAVADGAAVTRYATGPLGAFAAGAGRVALGPASAPAGQPKAAPPALRIFDPALATVRTFAVPELRDGLAKAWLAVDAAGKLVVATPGAVYAENERGELALRFEGSPIHGLAASGSRVWFAVGTELGVLEGSAVRATSGARLPASATLVGSSSGDVWALAGGALLRFTPDDGHGDAWERSVGPVFRRACADCHLPGGESDIDLSTKQAWELRRDHLHTRVLDQRSMPPVGHALSDPDREAIKSWLESKPAPVAR